MDYSKNMSEIKKIHTFFYYCQSKKWINELKKLSLLDIKRININKINENIKDNVIKDNVIKDHDIEYNVIKDNVIEDNVIEDNVKDHDIEYNVEDNVKDDDYMINIDEYQMKMMNKKVQIASQILIRKLEKFSKIDNIINGRELLTCLMISYYNMIFIPEDNKKQLIDYKLLNVVNLITNVLEKKSLSIKDLRYVCITISHFSEIFKIWKKFDKDRTIIGIVNSFYYRKEHLEEIKNSEGMNLTEDQKEECIKILEDDIEELKNSIRILDNSFDLENLDKNYKEIYKSMMKDINDISINTNNSMKLAFYDYLKNEIENGNLDPIYENLEEIKQKIKLLTPNTTGENHTGENIHKRLDELIEKNSMPVCFSNKNDIKKLFNHLMQIICSLSAPIDDNFNIEWLESTLRSFEDGFETLELSDLLPTLIMQLNEKIDRIIELISTSQK